jgi:outer membrane lipoprotein-sorting protein
MKVFLLVIYVFLAQGLAFAAEAKGTGGKEPVTVPLESSLAALQKQKSPNASYSAEFSTELFSAMSKKSRTSKGKVNYHPPSQFRWEVTKPESELYVATGTELWKYNAKAKHAQKMPMSNAGLEFLQVLIDPPELAKRYEILPWNSGEAETALKPAEKGSEKNSQKEKTTDAFDNAPRMSSDFLFVKLVPKVKTGTEDYLYVIADKTSGQVKEIRIAFKNGNRNSIAFEKWQEEKVSDLTFKFEPPPGTAIDKL